MYSPRGVINLAHSDAQRDAALRAAATRCGSTASMRNGSTATPCSKMVPLLDCSDGARFPIVGGLLQRRGGTARHDAVAWGYARGADGRGVDIIQNCEVTGFRIERGARRRRRDEPRVRSRAKKVGIAVAGHTGHVAAMAGLRCRSKATSCRPSSASRSSRCSIPS